MSEKGDRTPDATSGEGSGGAGSGDGTGGGGCPFHRSGGSRGSKSGATGQGGRASAGPADRSVDRRSFLRTALEIGGASALAAVSGCTALGSDDRLGATDVPTSSRFPKAFPERQHAWRKDMRLDPFGNVVLPTHQLLLFLNYAGTGTPRADERETAEAAFRSLEQAFQRLTGGDHSADNEGLVLMVGYSPTYFGRFEEDLPSSVGLSLPQTVLRKTNDEVDKADIYDAVVLLSSDTVPVLLAAEEALFGGLDSLNGVSVRGTLSGIFERADRRTGFTGKGLPREKLDEESIDEDAPLSMGYKSGFRDNLPSEDAVTITEGPFAEGTIFQVSKLRLDLEKWYERDRATRDELMFSHEHARRDIGDIGEELEDDSGITEDIVSDLEATAERRGRVGHSAKTAQARNDEFDPVILRRSEGINDAFHEDGKVDFNFSAVMEDIEDFIETRKAMNGADLDDRVEEDGNGILPFMTVTNRATFLIPPRTMRSLPPPRPAG